MLLTGLRGLFRIGLLALAVALAMVAALAVTGLSSPGARAQGTEPATLAVFIENYYKQPRPTQALALLLELDIPDYLAAVGNTTDAEVQALEEALAGSAERKREVDESHALAVLNAFYAHVLRANEDLAIEFADQVAARERPTLILLSTMALATAASDRTVDAVQRLFNTGALPSGAAMRMSNIQPFPFRTMTPRTHLDIDLLWACFYASGDPLYIRKIAESLAYWRTDMTDNLDLNNFAALSEDEQRRRREALIQAVMALTARETLRTNAANHPAVLGILSRMAEERTDTVGAVVDGIVAELTAGQF